MAGRKGITPVVAVILLLLMTIAAAGAAYLWMTRLSSMMTTGATEGFIDQQKKQNTRYTIDTIWNETNGAASDLLIVIRNSGSYEIPGPDFDKTAVYIDNRLYTFGSETAGRQCNYLTADLNGLGGNFPTDSVIKINCTQAYGAPVAGTYPKVSVKIQPPYGSLDIMAYQYSPY